MSSAIDAWLPKSLILLRTYDRQKFLHDLTAGVTVGLVALPLAMAFAIAPFHLHHDGRRSPRSSRCHRYGHRRQYSPRPVIVGFANGIAILIASTQIQEFFGLKLDHPPGDFFHRMAA